MAGLDIYNSKGVLTRISDDTLANLKSSFQGPLLRSDDADYEKARKVWNGLIDKFPALIARCRDAEDVVSAVNFVRNHDLLFSVRSGGHNVSGSAILDQGLVIDLSAMREVMVDERHRLARVAGGALLSDVDRATYEYGLATPLGVVSQTGVAGLTLHGGLGWQLRKHGMSLDNLAAAEVVTADGEKVRASAKENEDLYWALKGGGGNFGVVTSFELRLHELGPEVWLAAPIYPLDKASEVMSFCRGYMEEAPEELMMIGVYWTAPQIEAVPAQYYGKRVLILLGCYTGPPENGLEVIEPLCSITEPIADLSAQISWLEVQQFLDDDYPDGALYYWKSIYLDRLEGKVIDLLAQHTQKRPSLESSIDVWFLGGAMRRVPSFDTPIHKRDSAVMIGIEANWQDPKATKDNIDWARSVFNDLLPFSDGSSYLNFPGFVEGQEQLRQAVYGPNLPKLRKVKAKYDPGNLFRGLLNIAP